MEKTAPQFTARRRDSWQFLSKIDQIWYKIP